MLQTVANTVENERFELKTVAHTVEMAVSSSKMLQIAWKMVRTGNPKKIPQTKKKNPQTISYPFGPVRWLLLWRSAHSEMARATLLSLWACHGQGDLAQRS